VGLLGFAGDIEHFRRAGLHLGGQLIGSNAGLQSRVPGVLGQVLAIELLEKTQAVRFAGGSNILGGGRGKEGGYGRGGGGPDDRARVGLRQKSGGKIADLVVVSGNPDMDITAIGNTVMVFMNGVPYAPDLLRKSVEGLIGKEQ